MFLGQGMVWQKILAHLESGDRVASNTSSSSNPTPSASLDESTSQLRDSLMALADGDGSHTTADIPSQSYPLKRQKTNHDHQTIARHPDPSIWPPDHGRVLPPADLVDSLVEIYFERIHPWTPVLHYRKFKQGMADPERRAELSTIFHAIVSLCARFSDDPRLGDSESRASISKRSREAVILQSMESFSVRNLQALIICAFDTVWN